MLDDPALAVRDFNGFLLWEPREVPAPEQKGLRAHPDMTSFSEAWLSLPKPRRPLPPPPALRPPAVADWPAGVELAALGLEPTGRHAFYNFPPTGGVGTMDWGTAPSAAWRSFCAPEDVPALQVAGATVSVPRSPTGCGHGVFPAVRRADRRGGSAVRPALPQVGRGGVDLGEAELAALRGRAAELAAAGGRLSYAEYRDGAGCGEPDFAAGMRQFWDFGEAGAEKALAAFLARGMFSYGSKFTRADDALKPSSHFAPYLAAGDLSPNTVRRGHRGRLAGRAVAAAAHGRGSGHPAGAFLTRERARRAQS
jgi:hypothetical protein